jgi:uncharacterized oxidoreductase
MRIDHKALHKLTTDMLTKMGSSAEEAGIVADHLVEANMKGHPSHGVGMMPSYVKNWRDGNLQPNQHVALVQQTGNMAVFDGQMGYGQVVAREAMHWAIDTARATGSAIYTLRHAQHIGRVGTYAEQAVAAGLISIHFVNAVSGVPRVAPFGGSDGRVSTEPVCIGIPGVDKAEPVILDFATSEVALGKVRVAYKAGKPMAPGTLIDHTGQPTNDPTVIYEEPIGAVTPMGKHKGSGLAIICSLLGGALSGGGTIQPGTSRARGIVNGMFCVTFDPARLIGPDEFFEEAKAFIAHVKASPPANPAAPVMIAGEPERLHRARVLADGIELDEGSWADITGAAASLGVAA